MCSGCMRIPVKTTCSQPVRHLADYGKKSADTDLEETFDKVRTGNDATSEEATIIQREEVQHVESH